MTQNAKPLFSSSVPYLPGSIRRLFGQGSFKYWALVPMGGVLIVLTLLPIFQLFRMSVSEVRIEEGKVIQEYIGFDYFDTIQSDPIAPIAIKNTLKTFDPLFC